MINTLAKRLAPVAALALGLGAAGCDMDMDITINGEEGVALSELDMSGDAPNEIALFGPDAVVVTQGDELTIDVEGDPDVVNAMRFTLEDGTLGILRDSDVYDGNSNATIRVSVPNLSELTMGGSGTIEADSITGEAEVSSLGSGSINVSGVDTESLEVTIAGSGSVVASGSTGDLEVSILGSGSASMAELSAGEAEVSIAGSGGVTFASDGEVEANIMGSGSVVVNGNATCELNSVGSGTLRCETVTDAPSSDNDDTETEK